MELRAHVKAAVRERLPIPASENEASIITGRAVQTLRNRRAEGLPPRYIKTGRAVNYLVTDLLDFIESHAIEPRHI